MNRSTIISILISLLSFNMALTTAQTMRDYTEERPLIIVSDWEFPPYEFRNDKGEPDGYNVEVLNTILDKLEIPHKYVMQEWKQATQTFENHEADLIHAIYVNYMQRPYVMTQNMITYYNLKCVRRPSQPMLTKVHQLNAKDTLMLKSNDYASMRIKEEDLNGKLVFCSPKEALASIRKGSNSYFIWGELPLKSKIKEYHLDSLLLDNVDIPPGELRIVGYDKELIDAIDNTYARMEQSGELQDIHEKWFYPENVKDDTSPMALLLLFGAALAIIVAFLLSRLIRSRVRAAVNRFDDINSMMTQALQMGRFYVFEYDVDKDRFSNVYGTLLPDTAKTLKGMTAHIHPDQRDDFHKRILALIRSNTHQFALNNRFNMGSNSLPDWRYLQGNAITERKDGKTHHLVFTVKDITQEIEEEHINEELGTKYKKMFEGNLLPMSFYTREGWLIDVNEKMKEMCGFDDSGSQLFMDTNLFDMALIKGQYERGSKENMHFCQHMYYPENNLDKYVELRIRPTFDEKGDLRFYIVTGREVTAERLIYLEQQHHDNELRKSAETINTYERQLNYLLENSQMLIWRSDLRSGTISFSRSLRHEQYKESLKEYTDRIFKDEQDEAKYAINDAELMKKPFNIIHHFEKAYYAEGPVWYAISGIPSFDKDGNRIGYFGIGRNITQLIEAQEKLKDEMERANNSGKMKSAFLANMTHEIRTPLNAIVGFSDLLSVIDTKEERIEFIRIIRNNCDMLMRLINDILAASNMEQALAIYPVEINIADEFNDICQILAQRVEEPAVEFIKDNPYSSYITTLDKGRIQQILTNFVTNAVKYTHHGHIKVGYRQERRKPLNGGEETNGLYFYCEDTGAGIPKDKQGSVFERFVKLNDFVQGTGLGLSICQAITERCNGHIGVTSEGEGYGSTFWMWIPCEKK